ncbi:uncharacterized protein LOC134528086 isoform X4 [Bacillus rossius redtenbacheri]|uniref:uncharacterized protein LOC134528086 isoform X4 n=1 Tax=Bacillus rossius redtenbacheri TaxID=93214 RepID=UPI002FDCE14C
MAAGWTALVLLSVAGAGAAMTCFQSTCKNPVQGDCEVDSRAENCTLLEVAGRAPYLAAALILDTDFSAGVQCLKLTGSAVANSKDVVLKTCLPRTITCDAIKASVRIFKIRNCYGCDTDGCNSAPTLLISTAGSLLSAAIALMLCS